MNEDWLYVLSGTEQSYRLNFKYIVFDIFSERYIVNVLENYVASLQSYAKESFWLREGQI
jgi:hypothetical protein